MEASEFFPGGYSYAGNPQFTPERRQSDDHFVVEDLLDFSNEDIGVEDGTFDNSTDSPTVNVVDSCNSSVSGFDPNFTPNDPQFASELCVPYDDFAELEWLSNFVEESFSSNDMQKLQLNPR